MYALPTTTALVGAFAGMALASPLGGTKFAIHGGIDLVKVAYGQQIQYVDNKNHWVIWLEHNNPCPPAHVLGYLDDAPCYANFTLPGSGIMSFRSCDDEREPTSLFDDGQYVRTCTRKKHKTISCYGAGLHDIVKHGVCG